MTDNEIIEALEEALYRIKDAEYLILPKLGVKNLCNGLEKALDLINRQKAEIERLRSCDMQIEVSKKLEAEIKNEAYKEFSDELIAEAEIVAGGDYGFTYEIREDDIDGILTRLTAGKESEK